MSDKLVENKEKKINIKNGIRRIVIVFISLLCFLIYFVMFFLAYVGESIVDYAFVCVPIGGIVLYLIYLIIESLFIWIMKGFKNE